MSWKRSPNAKAVALAAWLALCEAGSGPGKLRIYSGSQPATGGGSLSGNTLLVEFTLNDPASSAGAFSTSPAVSATASATGTATWGRLVDSDGNAVADGTVGVELTLSSSSIVSGNSYSFTGGTITEG
jgi:hypothetical protein